MRAKTSGSSDWHDVASNITTTSHRYTTNLTIDYVAVRARNAGGPGLWAELSNMPSEDWSRTVTQQSGRGASSQSVQAQSQLAAPASITVWRENAAYQRKIDVSWSAVSGTSGYNVACSDKNGWHWWHCGSTTSGSTTQVTVTQNQLGERLDLRFYKIAVRAVTGNASEASAWKWSADTAYVIGELRNLTHSRSAGQITLSWKPNFWTTGYKIYCDEFTSRGAIAYTLCATLTGQDGTATQHTVTIPHSSNSTYTIDDAKTYRIKIVSINQWGANHMVAPHIYPVVNLSVSNIVATTATLNIANHSGDWYYKTNAAPDDTCQGPVSGASKDLTGLSAHTSYDYSAYSDSACTTANELASAASFTTLSSVSNLTSARSGDSDITSVRKQAVAFSISSTAASSDYILKTVTVPLKRVRSGTGSLTLTLHPMQGTGTYGSTSQPSGTAVPNTTLSGTAPTSGSYANTVFTCSGNGCKLERGKTYFVKATVTGPVQYAWNYSSTQTETEVPSGSGWDIGYSHGKPDDEVWQTHSTPDYRLASSSSRRRRSRLVG